MTNSNDTETLLDASIVKESANAYLVNVTVDSPVGLKGWNLWFPKSRSNWDGKKFTAESWLISEKAKDLPEWAWDILTESDAPQDLEVKSEEKKETKSEKKESDSYYGDELKARIQAVLKRSAVLKSKKEKREADKFATATA